MLVEFLLILILILSIAVPVCGLSVGDSNFKMLIDKDTAKSSFEINGSPAGDLVSDIWTIETDKETISSSESSSIDVKREKNNAIVVSGVARGIRWTAKCEQIFPASVTVTLTLQPDSAITLKKVSLFNASSDQTPVIAKAGLQDIAAFYRWKDHGMYVSLDFPYSKITTQENTISVNYPPYDNIKPGEKYTCHSYTIGATRVSGKIRYGYYEGEVQALDDYIQNRFKPRFERPIFMSASIVNRYTQLEGNWIFYTMKDHPTLTFNRDILKRELKLMKDLNIEFYQVFPGVFDWGPNDPSDKQVRDAMNWARSNHVRMGDYSGTTSVFCPHYNQYAYTFQSAGITPCFGNREFVKWYSDRVVNTAKKFGFEVHVLDFLALGVCNNPEHGHPTGEDSIYAQIKGLTDMMSRVASVSPNMLIWPNSGCWTDLLPKIAWFAPSQYLTDPFIATPWQGLNQTRLLDDARREQMVNLHYSHFIPYRFFTNCQYFFSQNSITPDIRKNYEYGALSTLAVTPNICPAEIRPWIDSLSVTDRAKVVSFYSKWTKFIQDNFELWKNTYQSGDDASPGSVEIYSHAEGNRGFVFVVNSTFADRNVEVALDSSMGFTGMEECEIEELYPTQRLRLTPQGPFVRLGTKLPFESPAQSVVVLEIRPKPAQIAEPRLYGLPGEIKKSSRGYTLKTRGAQGTTDRFAVLLPEGSQPIVSVDIKQEVPEVDRRQWGWDPTSAGLLQTGKFGALVELTFRRKACADQMRLWDVQAATYDDGIVKGIYNTPAQNYGDVFPVTDDSISGPAAGFLGAYLENGFNEDQETVLYLNTGNNPKNYASMEMLCAKTPEPMIGSQNEILSQNSSSWWFRTEFFTPQVYMYGCEPKFEEHQFIALPFKEPGKVKKMEAWINGYQVDVQVYRYPRNRGLWCRYIDIVGTSVRPGVNTLSLFVEFN